MKYLLTLILSIISTVMLAQVNITLEEKPKTYCLDSVSRFKTKSLQTPRLLNLSKFQGLMTVNLKDSVLFITDSLYETKCYTIDYIYDSYGILEVEFESGEKVLKSGDYIYFITKDLDGYVITYYTYYDFRNYITEEEKPIPLIKE